MNESKKPYASVGGTELSLWDITKILLAKIHWLLLAGVVVAAGVYAVVTIFVTPTYESRVSFYVYNSADNPATASGLYRLGHRALAFADCIRKKRRLQVTGEALHYRFLVLVDVNDCGLRGILSGMCCPKKSFGENSYVLSSPRRSVLYNGSLLAERT